MRRGIVFFAGLLFALLALEAGLRLVGFVRVAVEAQARGSATGHDKNRKVILCLGNSYTKGVGASPGMSYPEQLQRLLQKQAPGTPVQTINKGKEVQNTAELLSRLPEDLDIFKPDLVILQTGQPNTWNLIGYDDYLRRNKENGGKGSLWNESLVTALSRSRIYRLFLLWRQAVERRNEKPWFSLDEYSKRRGDPDYARAAEFIKEINSPFRRTKKEDVSPARLERFRASLERAVAEDPGYPFNYVYIGDTCRFQGKYEEAAEWYMRSLEVDGRPRSGEVYHLGYQAVRHTQKRLEGLKQERLQRRVDAFISAFSKKYPKESVNFFLLQRDEIARWTASDLEEIIREIASRKIPLILQNYPIVTDANGVLREIAGRHGIPFVDNKKAFDEKLANGARKEDLFVPDEHCNDAGYGLMAENVYRKITEAKLLG